MQNTNINWTELGLEFEKRSALDILKYSCQNLLKQGDIVFLTAFGPEGCILLEMLSSLVEQGLIRQDQITRDLRDLGSTSPCLAIANLDTGYQFTSSLELKQRLEERYKLPILMIEPELSVQEQDSIYGEKLYTRDPDQCCYLRKLKPLAKLLDSKLAWITSIRRDQSEFRANAQAFEFDRKFKLGKINPLIQWTKSDIWKYIHEHSIPYNPLLDQGYDSIGCEPCTSPGEGRKGRWAGKDKIECGLHIQDEEQAQGGEFVI